MRKLGRKIRQRGEKGESQTVQLKLIKRTRLFSEKIKGFVTRKLYLQDAKVQGA